MQQTNSCVDGNKLTLNTKWHAPVITDAEEEEKN